MSQPSGSSDSQSQSAIALKTWEMANKIETINTIDEIYRYDKQQQQDILTAKPWEKEYASLIDLELYIYCLL